jgi:hypothetical protein
MNRYLTGMLALVVLISMDVDVGASNQPWIPSPGEVGTIAVGLSTVAGVTAGADSLSVALHRGFRPSVGMNPVKGALTEDLMDRALTRGLLGETGWVSGTPARTGKAGLDGLFFRTDKSGNVRRLYVVEAKYGTSTLGYTRDGPQMGAKWIARRLERTAKVYADVARDLRKGNVSAATGLDKRFATNAVKVPLAKGHSATVWRTEEGLKYACTDKNVTRQEIERQARRTATLLSGAASGKIDYRSGIIRYDSVGNKHRITFSRWDPKNNVPIPEKMEVIEKAFRELPLPWQNAIRRAYVAQFKEMGYGPAKASKLARQACEDPQFFKTMFRDPKYSVRAGLDRYGAMTAGGGFLVGFLVDAGAQLYETGHIDWDRSLKTGVLGAAAGFAGYFTGSQVSALLQGTEVGRNLLAAIATRSLPAVSIASAFGSLAGGTATTAVFAYGAYLLGLCDIDTAHRQFAAGVGGVVVGTIFTTGTLAAITAFGTASTGTAISTLSGAAATNAALAWIGGGSIASGGLGVGIGGAILTGGTILIATGVVFGVQYVLYLRDISRDRDMIGLRIHFIQELVNHAMLIEWQRPSLGLSY